MKCNAVSVQCLVYVSSTLALLSVSSLHNQCIITCMHVMIALKCTVHLLNE